MSAFGDSISCVTVAAAAAAAAAPVVAQTMKLIGIVLLPPTNLMVVWQAVLHFNQLIDIFG